MAYHKAFLPFGKKDSEPIFCRGVASVPKVVSCHAANLEQAEMEIRDPSGPGVCAVSMPTVVSEA